jgi:hypothetical protein
MQVRKGVTVDNDISVHPVRSVPNPTQYASPQTDLPTLNIVIHFTL